VSGPRLVLDTHGLLWWLAAGGPLPKRLRKQIDRASDASMVAVSAISVWEVGMLEAKGRIALDRDVDTWSNDLEAVGRVELVAVDHRIAAQAALLEDFHGDPADRLIVASAIERGSTLVTRDDRITAWAKRTGLVQTQW